MKSKILTPAQLEAAKKKRIAKELRELGKSLVRIAEGIKAGKYK